MSGLFTKELRSRRTSALAFCAAIFGFVVLYISIFPTFQKQSASFGKIFASLPKGFSENLGVGLNTFTNVQNFLSVELFAIIWPLIAIIVSVSTAGSSIAGEVEKGTMGTLLSLPLGRAKIFWTKYLVGVLIIAAFVTSSLIAAMPLASLLGLTYDVSAFLLTALMCAVFALCVYSYAFLLSSVFNEKSRVYALAGGTLMLMYVVNLVSSLINDLHFLRFGSVFYYFTARQTLALGHINTANLAILIIPVIVFSVTGYIVFNRKDIAV